MEEPTPTAALITGGPPNGVRSGYFVNEHGEELVFAQRWGEKTARLWHSDADWEMVRVGDHSIRLDGVLEGMITVADLIIDRSEATWLSSCLAASRHLRPRRT